MIPRYLDFTYDERIYYSYTFIHLLYIYKYIYLCMHIYIYLCIHIYILQHTHVTWTWMQLSCSVGIIDVEINIDIHIHIIHIHIIHIHTTNRPCDMNAIPSLFLTLFWMYEIIAYYEKHFWSLKRRTILKVGLKVKQTNNDNGGKRLCLAIHDT